jgi:hypothetical protein
MASADKVLDIPEGFGTLWPGCREHARPGVVVTSADAEFKAPSLRWSAQARLYINGHVAAGGTYFAVYNTPPHVFGVVLRGEGHRRTRLKDGNRRQGLRQPQPRGRREVSWRGG